MDEPKVFYVVLEVCQGIADPVATYDDFTEAVKHVQEVNNNPIAEMYGVTAEWQEMKTSTVTRLADV